METVPWPKKYILPLQCIFPLDKEFHSSALQTTSSLVSVYSSLFSSSPTCTEHPITSQALGLYITVIYKVTYIEIYFKKKTNKKCRQRKKNSNAVGCRSRRLWEVIRLLLKVLVQSIIVKEINASKIFSFNCMFEPQLVENKNTTDPWVNRRSFTWSASDLTSEIVKVPQLRPANSWWVEFELVLPDKQKVLGYPPLPTNYKSKTKSIFSLQI